MDPEWLLAVAAMQLLKLALYLAPALALLGYAGFVKVRATRRENARRQKKPR